MREKKLIKRQAEKGQKAKAKDNPVLEVSPHWERERGHVQAKENPVPELEPGGQWDREQAIDTLNKVIQSLKGMTGYDKSALDLQIAAIRWVVGLLEPEKA